MSRIELPANGGWRPTPSSCLATSTCHSSRSPKRAKKWNQNDIQVLKKAASGLPAGSPPTARTRQPSYSCRNELPVHSLRLDWWNRDRFQRLATGFLVDLLFQMGFASLDRFDLLIDPPFDPFPSMFFFRDCPSGHEYLHGKMIVVKKIVLLQLAAPLVTGILKRAAGAGHGRGGRIEVT